MCMYICITTITFIILVETLEVISVKKSKKGCAVVLLRDRTTQEKGSQKMC